MRATKSNMKDQILTRDSKIIHCPECHAEYSGNAGDYFLLPEDHIFQCPECKCEMELVEKIVTVQYR